jgi:transposase
MPRLSEDQRNNAIGRLQAGEIQTHVSRVLNVSQSNISRLWDRYQQQGSTHDRPRSGRPRVTTPAQNRHIRLRHLRDRLTTATSTAAAIPGQRRISHQTVRNRLLEAGIRTRRPVKAVVLTRRHRQVRLQWVRTHRVWSHQHWSTLWFCDESRFLLKRGDGRARVYRRRNERSANNCSSGNRQIRRWECNDVGCNIAYWKDSVGAHSREFDSPALL